MDFALSRRKSDETSKRALQLSQMEKTGHVPVIVELQLPGSQYIMQKVQGRTTLYPPKPRLKANHSTASMIHSLHSYWGTNRKTLTFLRLVAGSWDS